MTAKLARILWTTALLVAACRPVATTTPAMPEPTQTTEQRVAAYVRVYGGLEGVYRSILDETDCDTLQADFYTATDNGTLGYQVAITDQAKSRGCPELRFTRP